MGLWLQHFSAILFRPSPPLPSELTLWSDSACVFNFHCRVRGWQREAQNWFSPLSVTEPATTSAFVFCSLRPHLYSAWLQSRRQHRRSYSTAYSPIYTVSGYRAGDNIGVRILQLTPSSVQCVVAL